MKYSVSTPEMMLPSTDVAFQHYAKQGYYQRQILMLGFASVTEWHRAIDVGAHIGFFSRDMAKFFDVVEAFEPHPINVECLKYNTPDNVVIHKHALGKEHKRAGLYAPSAKNSGSWEICDGDAVDVMPLDDYKFDHVGLMKIDVQGYEMDVLEGARNTIYCNKPVIILEVSKEDRDKIKEEKGFSDTMLFLADMGAEGVIMVREDVIMRWPNENK